MNKLFSLLLILFLPLAALSQDQGYKIGQVVDNFTLTGLGGRTVSLSSYSASKAVVLVFINNVCPNGRLYVKRLQDLATAYAGQGVSFIYISPTLNMENGGPQVRSLAGQLPITGESLLLLPDARHEVSSQFGATKVPEVFVLQPAAGDFVLKYKGAIDDNPQLEAGVQEHYLRNALEAVLANQPLPVSETRPFGCLIKKL